MSSCGATNANAGGSACTDAGDGTCVECGVALIACDWCDGVGYHSNNCEHGDEDIEPGPEQPFVDGVHAVLADQGCQVTVRIMAGQPRIDDDEDGPCGFATRGWPAYVSMSELARHGIGWAEIDTAIASRDPRTREIGQGLLHGQIKAVNAWRRRCLRRRSTNDR